jgi:hypothetical protein
VENLDAARVHLGDDELARVDRALAEFSPQGTVDVFGGTS